MNKNVTTPFMIRKAIINDAKILPDIEVDASKRFLTIPHLSFLVGKASIDISQHVKLIKRGFTWVAEIEGKVIGFLQAVPIEDHLHILELSISFLFQKGGIGSGLVKEAIQTAKSSGFKGLTLTTFAKLSFNEQFYQHLGFVTQSKPTGYLQDFLDQELVEGLNSRCAMIYKLV